MTKYILLSSVLFFAGCAAPIQYIKAQPKPNQLLVSPAKNHAILGVQEIKSAIHCEVLFEPTAGNELFNGMAVFWIYVKNLDRAPFSIGSGSISVEDKNGAPVEVMMIGDMAARLRANKSKQEWAFIIASSFLSAVEAAPYMQTQQTGVYSGYTSDGRYVTGTTVSTSQNPTVGYLAQQRNNDRIDSFSAQMNDAYGRAIWNLQRLSLKETVLKGGESVEGVVAVRLPSFYSLPNHFTFKLNIAGTVFSHDFTVTKKL